jgi:hypothetical protein
MEKVAADLERRLVEELGRTNDEVPAAMDAAQRFALLEEKTTP